MQQDYKAQTKMFIIMYAVDVAEDLQKVVLLNFFYTLIEGKEAFFMLSKHFNKCFQEALTDIYSLFVERKCRELYGNRKVTFQVLFHNSICFL